MQNKKKILNWVWFGFLLFIVSQLGRHFWFKESYVLGIRVDYLSPTIYFLDILWIVLFWFKRKDLFKSKKNWKWWGMFLGIGILNILVSERKGICFYKWLRWGQLLLTVEMVRQDRKIVWKSLGKVIPFWIIGEVFLGLIQVFLGKSVGGVWWWLGERSFSLVGPGIAKVSLWGVRVLRAYGTFSHPNSLAGFLLVSLMLWWSFKKKRKGGDLLFWWVVWWIGIVGLLICGSRLVWLVGLGVLSWEMVRDKVEGWKGLVGVLMLGMGIGVIVMGLSGIVGGWDVGSLSKRVELLKVGGKMLRDSPLLGIGMGNMVGRLPEYWRERNLIKGWLQPIHNIYLLVLVEIGVLGVWGLLVYLKKVFRNKKKKIERGLVLGLVVILITGFFDHYWISLSQNWWLMGVVFGLITGR